MSVYDTRDKPAYRSLPIDRRLTNNKYILGWLTSAHDRIIEDLIARWQWDWAWEVKDEVLRINCAFR